ncbi:MAG: SMP-30/gluconolactonase/LRE family protein [Pseudomonadota bacterium]
MSATQATCLIDCHNDLGEGLAWDAARQTLWWVDISGQQIHRLAQEVHTFWDVPVMPSALAPRRSGGVIVAAHGGLYTFTPDEGTGLAFEQAVEIDLPFNRSNDGGADPQGRFWFGTMQNNLAPDKNPVSIADDQGTLYRREKNGAITPVIKGLGIPNTLCWFEDRFYFGDSMQGVIRCYTYDPIDGHLSDGRDFIHYDRGVPDGSAIDAQGYLWNARWGGGCVARFAPDGSVDRIIDVPVPNVTNCCFGGPDLTTLYITTAARETPNAPAQAGGLFAVQTDIKGMADATCDD